MLVLALCIAYILGCLSPGWWLVRRATGADLRVTGSGGTGATNASRVLGAKVFVPILVIDVLKAVAAVLIARWIAPADAWSALALPAVVAGHIWPVQLGFKGGRGAGPLLGGCLAFNPWFAVAAAVPAAIAAVFTRRRFAVTTSAAIGGVACAWWLLPDRAERIAFALSAVLVVLAHRSHFMRDLHRPVP